jgi:hypothetical protein
VSCFKPFKTTFKKEKNNNMVKNNYNVPNKATFTTWVDKTLNVALSIINIKGGFKVIGIWPFNPKAMDGRIKPNEFYITNCNNTSYEDNGKYSNEIINTKGWGENGVIVVLINIATIINDIATTRTDVDGRKSSKVLCGRAYKSWYHRKYTNIKYIRLHN